MTEARATDFLKALTAVIITGGSSGIGNQLLKAITKLNSVARLCNLSRRKPADTFSQDRLTSFPVNLDNPLGQQEAVKAVRKWLAEEAPEGPLLLINNAGFGSYGPFPSGDPDRQASMVALNALAPVALTGGLLGDLTQRGGGILNIASVAGFQPVPQMSTYAATKSFLLHWSIGLAYDLKPMGVRVSCVCPGPTRTDFFEAARMRGEFDGAKVPFSQSAEEVALASLDAINRRRKVVVTGWTNQITALAASMLPRSWTARLAVTAMKGLRPTET